MRVSLYCLCAAISYLPHEVSALSHARVYDWSFRSPNLVGNWSFEEFLEVWQDAPTTGLTSNTRLFAQSEIDAAKSGSFIAKVSGTNSSALASQNIKSNIFPLRPSTAYTLSFYYRTAGSITGSPAPVISEYYSANGSGSTEFNGTGYSSASGWTLYVLNFTTSDDTYFAAVALAKVPVGAGGIFYFDDVVLEEGNFNFSAVLENRMGISEAATFVDGLGRLAQSQIKSDENGNIFNVTGSSFDDFGRTDTAYLGTAFSMVRPDYRMDLDASAKAYYGSGGPFDAKGYPFHRTKYPDQLALISQETSFPDSAWQFGKGHTVSSGFFFRNDSLVPSSIDPPSGEASTNARYRLDWTRSQDSSFTLKWTNKLGQVVRVGSNVTRSASSADTWKWAFTRYEYYTTGQLKRTLTPLDDSAGASGFAEVREFDAAGRLISIFSPDRNLRKFWYNRLGQLRYSQDSVQRASGKYTYLDYDRRGRLLSLGVQNGLPASLPQDSVDKDSYSQGTKTEQVGYIYDDTSTFYARTGFTLQEILGGWQTYVKVYNAANRLFCKYNRNSENSLPGFNSKDKFVADFYAYDDRGNVQTSWKFIGPIRESAKRLQDIWYMYDSQDRLIDYKQYTAAEEYALSSQQTYRYDHLGRIQSISGLNGKPIASYLYGLWGGLPLETVTLGGLPSGDSAVYVDHFYHSQGGLKEISVNSVQGASTRRLFKQYLGYEQKALAAAGVPSLSAPKYDGSISQQVYKYTSDMNGVHPVRAVAYNYDQLGRMGAAKAYWNTNSNPLLSNEDINTSTLSMSSTDSLSSNLDYDLNGRIKGQRSGGVGASDSAKYHYGSNSYALDRVTGKLSLDKVRDMSASGTFVYDVNGALVQDKSKKLKIDYGWNGMPVSFTMDSVSAFGALRCCTYDASIMPVHFKVRYPSLVHYQFYDADGNRVSRIEVESKPSLRLRSTNYVFTPSGMLKEWQEAYHLSGRVKSSSATSSIYGQSSMIGRIVPSGKHEFYVKNNLGSTVRTVDDRGNYLFSKERVMDYLAFGSSKDLKVPADGEAIRQKFTGKEFEDTLGLYAFGARWMDPELGIFTSPDPLGQYFNPFSYTGGDPANRVDPDGMWDTGERGGGVHGPHGSGLPSGYGAGSGWLTATPNIPGYGRMDDGRTYPGNLPPGGGGPRFGAGGLQFSGGRSWTYGGGSPLLEGSTITGPISPAGWGPNFSIPGNVVRNNPGLSILTSEHWDDLKSLSSSPGAQVPGEVTFHPSWFNGLTANELEQLGLTSDQLIEVYKYRMELMGLVSGNILDAVVQRVDDPALAGVILVGGVLINPKGALKAGIWTSTKARTAIQNAFQHYVKHGKEFGAQNALDYVRQARSFMQSPPPGTLSRVRRGGDVVYYNPSTNTYGVMDVSGAPRTMFKPDPQIHGFSTNMEYYLYGK